MQYTRGRCESISYKLFTVAESAATLSSAMVNESLPWPQQRRWKFYEGFLAPMNRVRSNIAQIWLVLIIVLSVLSDGAVVLFSQACHETMKARLQLLLAHEL